jgi:tetraacyldisaccharide 4'-kinase
VIRKTGQGSGTFLADTTDLSILRGKKAVAFGGLANNDQFFDSLKRAGCLLEHTFSFADHYRYVRNDIDRIARTAQEKGAEVIVTTFKDNVKIQNCNRWPVALLVVDVIIQITKPEDNFLSFLLDALHLPDNQTPEGFGR